jgi:hypothetical protein
MKPKDVMYGYEGNSYGRNLARHLSVGINRDKRSASFSRSLLDPLISHPLVADKVFCGSAADLAKFKITRYRSPVPFNSLLAKLASAEWHPALEPAPPALSRACCEHKTSESFAHRLRYVLLPMSQAGHKLLHWLNLLESLLLGSGAQKF